MNRRGFLAALMGAAVLDPEMLLWVPGARTISIPRRNVLLTPDVLRREVLRRLAQELAFHQQIDNAIRSGRAGYFRPPPPFPPFDVQARFSAGARAWWFVGDGAHVRTNVGDDRRHEKPTVREPLKYT